MAKKRNIPDRKGDTRARVARCDAYAEKVRRMFAATVNEILSLNLTAPNIADGVMYSFDGDTKRVQMKVEQLLRQLHSLVTTAIENGINLEWEEANKACDRIIKSQFTRQALNSVAMQGWNARNDAARRAFSQRTQNGFNLSSRIWKDVQQFREEMEVAITVSIGEGEDAGTISRRVRQYLNDPELMFRRFQYKIGEEDILDADGNVIGKKPVFGKKWKKRIKDPETGKYKFIDYDRDSYKVGRGMYKSAAKNAMRVARTETNIAYRRADHARWQDMDFVLGVRIQLSNSHPKKDICDKLAGDYPKDFVFDGWHPQCFCFATPILMDADEIAKANEAFARGEEYTPKGKPITDYPQGFKDFVRDNKENIIASRKNGSAPYFVQNNAGIIDGILGEDTANNDANTTAKGDSSKGSSRSLTTRLMREIDDDYKGKTALSPKQDENIDEIAELFGLSREEVTPMTFKEADNGNSNLNRGNPQFDNNCTSCVFANEMRRRGFDVTAATEIEEIANDIRRCWKNKNDETPDFMIDPKKLTADNPKELLDMITKLANANGGRYILGWSGVGMLRGHVLCVERINGELCFYDPQESKTSSFWNINEIIDRMDKKAGLELLRIDNLQFNVEFVERMVNRL